MSLSRRRSLRRGTPGHDGFPRALGIMPRHFLRRGIRTHNEIPRALGIMRPHHRTHPVGVTLGKKLSSRKTGELLCLSGKRIKAKSHMCFEKPPLLWLFETHVASQRYRNYCADASAEAVVASAEPAAVASAEALGLSDGTGEADAVPGARRTIRHVPSW